MADEDGEAAPRGLTAVFREVTGQWLWNATQNGEVTITYYVANINGSVVCLCCNGSIWFQQWARSDSDSFVWNLTHPAKTVWHPDTVGANGWFEGNDDNRCNRGRIHDAPGFDAVIDVGGVELIQVTGTQFFLVKAYCWTPGQPLEDAVLLDEFRWHAVTDEDGFDHYYEGWPAGTAGPE